MILENEIYLVDETARYFKINDDSVRKLIKDGKLKAFKLGKGYRITGESILNLVKENTVIKNG